MASGRERIRDLRTGTIGSIRYGNGSILGYSSQYSQGEVTVTKDVIGNRDGINPFDLERTFSYGGLLNGNRLATDMKTVDRIFTDYPISGLFEGVPDPRVGQFPMSTLRCSDLAWRLLAETNPGKPHIEVPAIIGEFRDIPGLIRGWGRCFFTDLARSNLVSRWMIAPALSDLRKMLSIVRAINARHDQLKHFAKGQKAGRGKGLENNTRVKVGSRKLMHSNQMTLYGRFDEYYTEKVWGSVEWYAPHWSWYRNASDDDLLQGAIKQAYGLTPWNVVATTWELLPWSWLIDWFSNVGTMIQALHNSIDLSWRNICIMQKCRVDQTFVQTDPLHPRNVGITYNPIIRWKERKLRYTNPLLLPFPTPRLPILTDGKLSIIASLAALRIPEGTKLRYLRS
jgi:hypothetical protein